MGIVGRKQVRPCPAVFVELATIESCFQVLFPRGCTKPPSCTDVRLWRQGEACAPLLSSCICTSPEMPVLAPALREESSLCRQGNVYCACPAIVIDVGYAWVPSSQFSYLPVSLVVRRTIARR